MTYSNFTTWALNPAFIAPDQPFEDTRAEVQDGIVDDAGQEMTGSMNVASAEVLDGLVSTHLQEEAHIKRGAQNEGSIPDEGEEVDEDDEAFSTEDNQGAPDEGYDAESQRHREGEWELDESLVRQRGELLPIVSLAPGVVIPISLPGLSPADISQLLTVLARESIIQAWGELHNYGPLYVGNPGDLSDESEDNLLELAESHTELLISRHPGNPRDYSNESEDDEDFDSQGDYVDDSGFLHLLQEMIGINYYSQRGPPPAARIAVDGLPLILIQQRDLEHDGLAKCAICMDRFTLGEPAKQLPCLHHYHEACILPWLRARNSCPICRYELPTDSQAQRPTSWNNISRRNT